jgi:hypothetical protein
MRVSILNFLFVFVVSNPMVFCQKNGIGLGIEINQTRFRQYAPTVKVAFENPHDADFGIGGYFMFFHRFSNKMILNLKPGLTILNTKSDVTSAHTVHYFILNGELGYFFNKSNRFNMGVEYAYLIALLATYKSQTANFTFFLNHRHSINPTISFEHHWDKNWTTQLKFTYFTKDLFNSGALDSDGNLVGPVKVTPYTFALGFNFYYPFKSKKIIKETIREGNSRTIRTN